MVCASEIKTGFGRMLWFLKATNDNNQDSPFIFSSIFT